MSQTSGDGATDQVFSKIPPERADGGGARAGLAARAASDAGGGGYAAS